MQQISASLKNAAKPSVWTPFNIVAGIIIAVGLVLTVIRFTGGLDAVSDDQLRGVRPLRRSRHADEAAMDVRAGASGRQADVPARAEPRRSR